MRAKGLNPDKETLLIVCGLSKTEDKKVTIYSPYYGMGANHTRGICFTADMEWLSIDGLRPDPDKITLQVKEHRGYEPFSLGRFNTVYIGGTFMNSAMVYPTPQSCYYGRVKKRNCTYGGW